MTLLFEHVATRVPLVLLWMAVALERALPCVSWLDSWVDHPHPSRLVPFVELLPFHYRFVQRLCACHLEKVSISEWRKIGSHWYPCQRLPWIQLQLQYALNFVLFRLQTFLHKCFRHCYRRKAGLMRVLGTRTTANVHQSQECKHHTPWRNAPSACSSRITSLYHEISNDAMKDCPIVVTCMS